MCMYWTETGTERFYKKNNPPQDYKRRHVGNKPYIKGTGRVVTLTIDPALVISTSNMDMIMKDIPQKI